MKNLLQQPGLKLEPITSASLKSKKKSYAPRFEDRLGGFLLKESLGGADIMSRDDSWLDLDRAVASGIQSNKFFSAHGTDDSEDEEIHSVSDDSEEDLGVDELDF